MDLLNELSIAVPWRTDSSRRREAIFEWNMDRLQRIVPEVEIVLGDIESPIFSYSAARNVAVSQAEGKYILILDSDVVLDASSIQEGVRRLQNGANWVVPYQTYHVLNDEYSDTILNQPTDLPLSTKPRSHISSRSTAGAVMLQRDDFIKVGGYDERFMGWGYEHMAFCEALGSVVGQFQRCKGTAQHLWHDPPAQPAEASPFLHLNKALYNRYRKLKGNAEAIVELTYQGSTL